MNIVKKKKYKTFYRFVDSNACDQWGNQGKKMKNKAVSNKMKKKEKGESVFFVNIWHTFVDNCILT